MNYLAQDFIFDSDFNISKPIINWEEILKTLHMDNKNNNYVCQTPEEMIHEICHVYVCKGDEAFQYIGTQHDVADEIKLKFKTIRAQNRSEAYVSAMTLIVTEYFGFSNLKEILDSMWGNMQEREKLNKEYVVLQFTKFLYQKTLLQKCNKIIKFIKGFEK